MKQMIGIDVSKAKLDILWLRDIASEKVKTKVLPNDKQGHASLVQWLCKTTQASPQDIVVVMEATGIYHENVAHHLYEAGFQVAVVNPARTKDFAKSLGKLHKTDKLDSLMLAHYATSQKLILWQPEPPAIRVLKALLARLESVETDLNRESNRLEKAEFSQVSFVVIDSIHTIINELKKEKVKLEQQIDEHIDQYPNLKNDRQLLESIPGIGPVLSRIMLSVIHARHFSQASQVAAFVGVIPVITESGVFKGRSRLSKKGSAKVRAKLYMAAVVASQYNQQIIAQKKRLLAHGKTKMQALGAAMKKLVLQCFAVIKHQTEYSPQAA